MSLEDKKTRRALALATAHPDFGGFEPDRPVTPWVTFRYEPVEGFWALHPPEDDGKALIQRMYELTEAGRIQDASYTASAWHPTSAGYKSLEIKLVLWDDEPAKRQVLMLELGQLLGLDCEAMRPPGPEVCFHCEQPFRHSMIVGARRIRRLSEIHAETRRFQLCTDCQRSVCRDILARDMEETALLLTWEQIEITCGCKACREAEQEEATQGR